MPYIYRHIRLDKNIPFYIGIGSDFKYNRANSIRDRNIYWKRITNKTQYRVEIMLDDLSWEEACEKEKEFIQIYGRVDLKSGTLCNLTNGGDGARGVIFDEHRRKEMSERYSGEKNPFYGKKHSNETINRLIDVAKNRDPEVYKKIADKNRNRKTPDDVRIKISNSTKGDKNHFFGKHHTEETKRKISDKKIGVPQSDSRKIQHRLASSKRIELFRYVDGVFYSFLSMREASIALNISRSAIKLKFKELGFITKQEAIDMGLL